MTEIKAGDVVTLKSGGPLMAVRRIDISFSYVSDGEDMAVCQWFEGPDLKTATIATSVLEVKKIG